MAELNTILADAIADDTCLLIVLSKPAERGGARADRVKIRPIRLRGERHYQWTHRTAGRETHENLDPSRTLDRVAELFGGTFGHAHLYTTAADYAATLDSCGSLGVRQSPPTRQRAGETHDQAKNYLIPVGTPCPFLVETGIMTPSGNVRSARFSKFRQVNRFLELVNDSVRALPADRQLTVVDFGCGKSYLTFALQHLLSSVHGRQARIIGLDRNEDVIRDCRRIADRIDQPDIEFRVGDIAGFQAESHIDLVICLHACDTATDDSLAQAVRWQADVILAVPCCQHELAARLDPRAMPAVTQHGILHERLAALATDALRAEALEICGYKCQVVEFIDIEHTAKNVLIRAVRRAADAVSPPADKVAAYRQLKDLFGLDEIYLERALGSEFAAGIRA